MGKDILSIKSSLSPILIEYLDKNEQKGKLLTGSHDGFGTTITEIDADNLVTHSH